MTTTPDLCVIGGGAAGHAVALAAAALGARCTLVDPREGLGSGQAADLAEAMVAAAAHARRASDAPFDLAGFRRRLGQAMADMAPNHAAARLRTLGVTVVRAEAAFADARTVVAGETAIRARRFVLATGAYPAPPPWMGGLDPDRLLRPATLGLRLTLPAAVTVVAETPEGLAWAQILRRLGAAVTLVAAPGAFAPFDAELVAIVLAALRRGGVEFRLEASALHAEPVADGVRLNGECAGTAFSVEATHVLATRAPVPALAGLRLERAGIACAQGRPVVDAGLRTTNRRVFAVGDVLGEARPGGGAVPHQVGLVLRAALFRQPVRYRPERVPITLATDPALAQVGDLGGPAGPTRRVLRWPLSETLHGVDPAQAAGGVKIVTTPGGRVLGAGLAGPAAAEAIGVWSLAMARKTSALALAGLPALATPLAEASRRAGLTLMTARLGGRWVRRLLALLRALP